jgi:hypothetical protein
MPFFETVFFWRDKFLTREGGSKGEGKHKRKKEGRREEKREEEDWNGPRRKLNFN